MLAAWVTGVWWGDVLAVWVGAACLLVIGWALRGTLDGRGGMIDLTGAQPSELDLDWSDPRPHGRIDENERRELIEDFTRPFHSAG